MSCKNGQVWANDSSGSEGPDSQAAKNLEVLHSQNMDIPLMRMKKVTLQMSLINRLLNGQRMTYQKIAHMAA